MGMAGDRRQPIAQVQMQGDAVTFQLRLDKPQAGVDHVVHREGVAWLLGLVPREHAQVIDGAGHPVHQPQDVLHHLLHLFFGKPDLLHETDVDAAGGGGDGREGLVEFVGHAGGHLAQGDQAGGLQDLRLQLPRFEGTGDLPDRLVQERFFLGLGQFHAAEQGQASPLRPAPGQAPLIPHPARF